jgi:HK97 family phage major capsid protein
MENDIVECVDDIQDMVTNQYERLDKQTKSALEEFTRLKTKVDDQTAILNSLKKAQFAIKNEQRLAIGDPIKRILCDDGATNLINATVRKLCGAPLNSEHKKALGEDSLPGNTYIQDEVADDIYDVLCRYGQWATLGVRRLGTKSTSFPVETTRPNAKWIMTEGSQIADDTVKAGTSVELTLKLIAVLINVSRQLLDDTKTDITADILNDFAEACAHRLDYAAFIGNGANDADNGGFTGIFNGGTVAQAQTGHTKIEQLTLEDITNCLTNVSAGILSRNAKWWIHPQNRSEWCISRTRWATLVSILH